MKLPLAPLLELVGGDNLLDSSRRMGVSFPTLHRWQQHGIPLDQCDRLACRFGSHPLLVWGPSWSMAEAARAAFREMKYAQKIERNRERRRAA